MGCVFHQLNHRHHPQPANQPNNNEIVGYIQVGCTWKKCNNNNKKLHEKYSFGAVRVCYEATDVRTSLSSQNNTIVCRVRKSAISRIVYTRMVRDEFAILEWNGGKASNVWNRVELY